ncbi:uncharacterized protein AKAW2_70611A [Aspergillus luchuensis]|uniref:Uncharacterized protein n=1 Tax=Aspergillus kawachii TaxID=1069201 RepID=A0A7R7WIP7_ASPKA|nr:uncharacterized protein AKAW2_70611A [Aspergillus luchuensis]BCS03733.1 hypothetical protein AKAW2_70611A [Aspergillus luchuensis]
MIDVVSKDVCCSAETGASHLTPARPVLHQLRTSPLLRFLSPSSSLLFSHSGFVLSLWMCSHLPFPLPEADNIDVIARTMAAIRQMPVLLPLDYGQMPGSGRSRSNP